jgi:hypothetical protein
MGNPFLIAEDEALKEYIKGMTVADEKSAAVNGPTGTIKTRPVKVWFGYPDVEIAKLDFPFVTIDLIDIMQAPDRQMQGRLVDTDYRGTVAPQAGYVYEYDMPVAYDLIYQLTTYSRHPRHDRAILFQMWNKFPSKYGKLSVSNQLGTESSVRSMFVDGFAKRDTFEDAESGNRRLLRNIFTIRLVSEMTPSTAAQKFPAVQEVLITQQPGNQSFIPTSYHPV